MTSDLGTFARLATNNGMAFFRVGKIFRGVVPLQCEAPWILLSPLIPGLLDVNGTG